jgi:hypothetical protein
MLIIGLLAEIQQLAGIREVPKDSQEGTGPI